MPSTSFSCYLYVELCCLRARPHFDHHNHRCWHALPSMSPRTVTGMRTGVRTHAMLHNLHCTQFNFDRSHARGTRQSRCADASGSCGTYPRALSSHVSLSTRLMSSTVCNKLFDTVEKEHICCAAYQPCWTHAQVCIHIKRFQRCYGSSR